MLLIWCKIGEFKKTDHMGCIDWYRLLKSVKFSTDYPFRFEILQ